MPAPGKRTPLHSPTAARRLATGFAELLVEVEGRCASEGCGPDCQLRRSVAKVAVSASMLAHQLQLPGYEVDA